jgi:anti-sigma B factor antagonist
MNNRTIIPGFQDQYGSELAIDLARIDDVPDGVIVSFSGRLSYNAGKWTQNQLSLIVPHGFRKVILDYTDVTYTTSAGMAFLTQLYKQVVLVGGDLVLTGLKEEAQEVFSLLGFSQFFVIRDTVGDAVDYFRSGATTMTVSSLPTVISCPSCDVRLRFRDAGRHRCPRCRTPVLLVLQPQASA